MTEVCRPLKDYSAKKLVTILESLTWQLVTWFDEWMFAYMYNLITIFADEPRSLFTVPLERSRQLSKCQIFLTDSFKKKSLVKLSYSLKQWMQLSVVMVYWSHSLPNWNNNSSSTSSWIHLPVCLAAFYLWIIWHSYTVSLLDDRSNSIDFHMTHGDSNAVWFHPVHTCFVGTFVLLPIKIPSYRMSNSWHMETDERLMQFEQADCHWRMSVVGLTVIHHTRGHCYRNMRDRFVKAVKLYHKK